MLRIFCKKARFLKQLASGRILEIESVLFKAARGDKPLSGYRTSAAQESPILAQNKQSAVSLEKPTPKRIKMITNLEALKTQSIVGVIERYIPLRKNGANFIACCPFHSEKSPSFVVSDVKGMFKCFGCGKGGDVVSFIKEYEKIDFNQALKRLSELTGIALEYDKAQKVGKSPSEVLEKINALAKQNLAQNAQILAYLQERGLTREICEKYDIGLVPSKQELLQHFSAQELVESGFANEYEKGKISIPMRERIGIAIRNPQHKLVAFVARTHPHYNFPPNAPKYINSKESYFYKKTQILYLLSHARAAITQSKSAFIVEGYIDSILLHENGYKNAIATGGTAFNVQHLNLLTRLDCEVIFCFDNDKSGMAANFRAVKVCFNAGFYRVKVAILQVRDERGRLCKDINEALLCGNTLQANILDSSSTRISSLKGGQGGLNCEVAPLIPPLTPQAPDDAFKVARKRATIDCMDSASAELREPKAQSSSEKLEFNYLSGFEFFIKWLYKNKDKQQAFNEIKAAINACQNFYDKQEFLDTACKLTGVPSEYFTHKTLPQRAQVDNYSTLIASILHNEECAYIASELDLSFIPQHKQLQAFLHTGENKELASFIESKPMDTQEFYQHYCDLYLAHLSREQTKAKAKKDLKLVLALSEKIAQVQRDIQAQKAF